MAEMDSNRLALQISLIGPWRPFDPINPFPGEANTALRAQLRSAGLMDLSPTPDAQLVLAATLVEGSDDPDADVPPLFASLLIHEHSGRTRTLLTEDGAIVPDRRTNRTTIDWPEGDVGAVEFHEVGYLVALPESSRFYTLVFMTPNIPAVAEMEFLFDSIVATVEWVDPAA